MEYAHLIALRAVALAFDDLLPQVVFVGGATVGLYATQQLVPLPRPTDDVDCVIDLASYAQFAELEERLRRRGFRHDYGSGMRWQATPSAEVYTVDIMPADGGIVLGNTVNRWYRSGMASCVRYKVAPDGPEIQLLDAPHFIATKLEAMRDRATDMRWSQDWEDIIYVLETRKELSSEIQQAPEPLRQFVAASFAKLLSEPAINEWLESVRDPAGSLSALRKRCQELADI